MAKCNWCGCYYEDKGNWLGDKETFIEQGFCCNKCMYSANQTVSNNPHVQFNIEREKETERHNKEINSNAFGLGCLTFLILGGALPYGIASIFKFNIEKGHDDMIGYFGIFGIVIGIIVGIRSKIKNS